MDAFGSGVAVAASVFAGGIIGLHLHRVLPERHLSKETQDVIRLGTGMLSVLASLVLGLLIATARTSFNSTGATVRICRRLDGARRDPAFLVLSLAIGSALFLIVDMDSPFAGVLRISSRPVATALGHMLTPGQ